MRERVTHDDLMRYLDGELSPEARRRVEEELARSTELQREVAIYRAMGEDLRELSFAVEPAGSLWEQVNRQIARPVGWIFLVSGAALWAVYGGWVFLTSPVNRWEKLAAGTAVIGLLILLGSTLWERYREAPHDLYRHIQR